MGLSMLLVTAFPICDLSTPCVTLRLSALVTLCHDMKHRVSPDVTGLPAAVTFNSPRPTPLFVGQICQKPTLMTLSTKRMFIEN